MADQSPKSAHTAAQPPIDYSHLKGSVTIVAQLAVIGEPMAQVYEFKAAVDDSIVPNDVRGLMKEWGVSPHMIAAVENMKAAVEAEN